jgi:hypothetical protein
MGEGAKLSNIAVQPTFLPGDLELLLVGFLGRGMVIFRNLPLGKRNLYHIKKKD